LEITEKIKHLNREQLDAIVTARRAVSVTEFVSVNGKARAACIQRHYGWQDQLLKFTNASIEASVRSKIGNAISTAAIVSAFEAMGLGIIAKTDLELDEYDTIISPVISAFPELVVLKQDWTVVPLEQNKGWRPAVQYQPPPMETRGITEKKGRPYRRHEDLETAVADAAAADINDIMAALKPKNKEPEKKLTGAEAIAAMLAAIKKPEEKIIAIPDNSQVPVFETVAEILEIEVVSDPQPKKKFTTEEMLKMMQPKKLI